MQYKLLVSDFDNTLVPFGEPRPRPAVVLPVRASSFWCRAAVCSLVRAIAEVAVASRMPCASL